MLLVPDFLFDPLLIQSLQPVCAEVQAEAPLGVGSAHIGEYSVQTHAGNKFTHAQLQDDFAIVYFGTTSDRECVTELEKLGEVVQQSGAHLGLPYHLFPVLCKLLHLAAECTGVRLMTQTCKPHISHILQVHPAPGAKSGRLILSLPDCLHTLLCL